MIVLTIGFLKILRMSGIASLCILAVLAARLALGRAPRRVVYLLWAAVLFRLLCPVTLSLWMAPAPLVQSQAAVEQTVDTIAGEGFAEVEKDYLRYKWKEVPLLRMAEFRPVDYGACIWAAGIIGMAVAGGVSLFRLKRRLTGAVRLEGNVWLADHLPTPFVLGLFRPKIYLPSELTEEEQPYVLCHERTHIRRGDPVWKLLACVALAVHWFNPLVWLAFWLADRDMEDSCDEAVLRKMGGTIRRDYAASLLRFGAGRRLPVAAPLAFGESGPAGRVKRILSYKKPAVWITAVAIAAAVVLSAVLLADTAAEDPTGAFQRKGVTGVVTMDVELMWRYALWPDEDGNMVWRYMGGDHTALHRGDLVTVLEEGEEDLRVMVRESVSAPMDYGYVRKTAVSTDPGEIMRQSVYVKLRNADLYDEPEGTVLGKIYGTRVKLLKRQGEWVQVEPEPFYDIATNQLLEGPSFWYEPSWVKGDKLFFDFDDWVWDWKDVPKPQ